MPGAVTVPGGPAGALATTVLIWASTYAAIRVGLLGYGAAHLALLRFLVASAALGVFACSGGIRRPRREDARALACLGLIGMALYHLALNTGQRGVTAGAASFLISTSPVFTAILDTLWGGTRLGARRWAGVAVCGVGILALATSGGATLRLSGAAWLVLLAALAQAIHFTMQRPYLSRYRPVELTAYAVWSATLVLLVFLPGLVEAVRSAPGQATRAVIYLGLFPTVIAHVTFSFALAHLSASRAASFLYLTPVAAVPIAWLWLGEVPLPQALLGGALAMLGVALVNWPTRHSGMFPPTPIRVQPADGPP